MNTSGIRRVLRAAVALALVSSSGCTGTGSTSSCWSSRAPLPIPRAQHALVALGGRLYAIGGYSGTTLARVDRYDPASDSWTPVADMRAARQEFAAGAVNGKIYVACGMSSAGLDRVTYVTTTEEYDPVANTWTARAPCPMDPAFNDVYGNVHIAGAAANGRLYVVVFNTQTTGLGATYVYDPVTDTWSTGAGSPFTSSMSAVELDGSLYVLSGNPVDRGRFARYDPADDTWIIRQSLGVYFPGGTLVAHGGAIYAVGGAAGHIDQLYAVPDVNKFAPAANAWGLGSRLAHERCFAGSAEVDGTVYVAGGSTHPDSAAFQPLDAVEASSDPWCPKPTSPPVPLP